MHSSIEKLRKFFRLEHENGYTNKAVIGGLANVRSLWEGEARNDKLPEEIVQATSAALHAYADQTPAARLESLKFLWKQILEKVPEAALGKKKASVKPAQRPPQPVPAPVEAQPVPEPEAPPVVPEVEQKPESAAQEQGAAPQPPAPKPAPAPAPRPQRAVPGRAEASPGGVTSKRPIALNASLTVLAGVGPRHASMLTRLGLNTLGDMLYNFPHRYEDYSQLKPIRDVFYGQQVTVIGEVSMVNSHPLRGGKMTITEAVINDGTGGLRLTWFNQPWLTNTLKVGEAISVSGKVEQYLGRLVMNSPDWEPVEVENLHTNRIVPIYSLTANVTQKWLRKLMHQVVTYWAPKLTDHLPETIRQAADLPDLGTALLQAHFPDSDAKLQAARQRLAFDEIFFLQTGVLRQRRDWQSLPGRIFEVEQAWLEARLAALPFALTNTQKKAVADIRTDLKSGQPMNRLLQGDVGSGKTVVAAIAAAMVNQSGAQAAIMAPTSILADQHFHTFQNVLAGENGLLKPEQIRLLVGDTSDREKEDTRAGLASGEVKIVIGTHALIEDPVTFADLQYVVVDEQHRFGVEQRAALRSKGTNPHLLVMTATPIPRSLALTLYGDLDLSIMDELPPGRQTIPTHILTPQERERAYTLVRSQIKDGHQAFIIYPLVEESEKSELLAATQEHDHLQKEIFPDLKLGLLHGRMKAGEKDATMLAFREKQYDILVSTTVVEVGVDVPNATVMLIEGANHFGLAQLHQLRGRVGRSEAQSYCLLIPDHEDAAENERLKAMTETNDGFVLAERDLQQRGPGEFLGTRQAGYATSLKMASLSDIQLIEKARTQAQALFARDPDLKDPENTLLAEALGRFWGGGKGDVS
ncbi:MAG: ATP-dependent DNA helicase RecG [Anaerolineales bacterium]|nr:ATP-dependent DNA helicase RecG [Anaerolineales bacterium]